MSNESNRGLELGKLVRLRTLKAAELPSHPELAPQQSSGSPPDLQQFISHVLKEAEEFMVHYLPRHSKVKDSKKQSPPSSAPVELLSCEIAAPHLPAENGQEGAGSTGESWFARTSYHENAAKDGTASWEEFDAGLRSEHSKHEREYTPDVQDDHKVLDWDKELEGVDRRIDSWEDVQMGIVEMLHHIPPPLNDRVFPELIITARKATEFLVVQIPVDSTNIPSAKYNGKGGKIQSAMYVSIERGELVENASKVKWQMATASDAKGVLPMWAQKMGVPGAVVKDVGLFIGWTAKRRQGKA